MSSLNAKISNALSTSFADIEIRDAFQTLDQRGIKNTPETRRNFRLDAQKEIIDCNAEIIDDFGKVAEQLRRTGDALSSLQKTCAALRQNINTARVETAPMLDEANNLTRLTDQVQDKQQILSDFNRHFLMSDDELVSLTSSADAVDDAFFQALVKAKQVQKDSEILLGGENQRLGLEILEQCNKNLNATFQKLYHWAQREFQTLDLEDSSLSSIIRRALRVLAERPTMFQECLSKFAEVRERTLADAFYLALTGTPADRDTQKPIEFSAHEPLRYVGDMLAWVHSTAVSERESLEVLFIAEGNEIARSIEAGLESEPWLRPDSGEVFNGKRALSQLVNQNLTGVARLLRQRIDTVIRTHHEPVLEYKIANLVVFYRKIFAKLLQGEDFMHTLDNVEDIALAQFRTAMRSKLAAATEEEDAVTAELEAPDFLEDALDELHDLLKSYDTSAAMSDDDGQALSSLLGEAFEPWLEVCERLSLTLEPPSNECFTINCLLAARAPLSQFQFTKPRVLTLNDAMQSHTSNLIDYEHGLLLARSGLRPLVEALDDLTPSQEQSETILKHQAFSQDRLLAAREMLDKFLPSALMDAVADLRGLQSSSLSHEIANAAAESFCQDFARIEAAVVAADRFQLSQRKTDEDLPTLRDVFPRTTEETRILLS